MQNILAGLRERHGGAAAYLQAHGLREEELAALRRALVAPAQERRVQQLVQPALGQPGQRLQLERVEEPDLAGLQVLDAQARAVARRRRPSPRRRELAA